MAQAAPAYLTIVLRTASNSEALGNSLRSSIAGLDPDLPIYRIRTARAAVDQGLGSISLLGSLLGAFATIGLILAAIGIYGVVSYTVVQRTGELGIRHGAGSAGSRCFVVGVGQGRSSGCDWSVTGCAGCVWRIETLDFVHSLVANTRPVDSAVSGCCSRCGGAVGLLHTSTTGNASRSAGGAAIRVSTASH